MVNQPVRARVHLFATAGSLMFGCLWSAAVTAQVNCPPFNLTAVVAPTAAGDVSLQLTEGLLQPQLEALLARHFQIDMVDWQASPHHRWPADFRLQAPSWPELLERLLRPYRLAITLYPNRMARIAYQPPGGDTL